MACAVATGPVTPSIADLKWDFPAWLETQGVNAEVARAMDSELGIRDYGFLCACVGDGLVRAELLATARDRLPFGFYAVLRQMVKALCLPEASFAAAAGGGGAGAGGSGDGGGASGGSSGGSNDKLRDVLVTMVAGLSQELSRTMRSLCQMAGSAEDGGDVGGGDAGDPSRSSQTSPTRTSDYGMHEAVSIVSNHDEHATKLEPVYVSRDPSPPAVNSDHSSSCANKDRQNKNKMKKKLKTTSNAIGCGDASHAQSAGTNEVISLDSLTSEVGYTGFASVGGSANGQAGETGVGDSTAGSSDEIQIRCSTNGQHEFPDIRQHVEEGDVLLQEVCTPLATPQHQQQEQQPVNMCTVCGRMLRTKAAALRHVKRHRIGELLYRCSMCGRGYRQQAGLRYHEVRCPEQINV